MKNIESAPDVVLTWTCLAAPEQIEGTVGGRKVYYRSRHDRWRVEIDDEIVAYGDASTDESMSDGVRRIIEACWHPYISDAINAREDARFEQ